MKFLLDQHVERRLAAFSFQSEQDLFTIWYNDFKEKYMMAVNNQSLLQQSDALYERYGKPLEKTQRGKYGHPSNSS